MNYVAIHLKLQNLKVKTKEAVKRPLTKLLRGRFHKKRSNWVRTYWEGDWYWEAKSNNVIINCSGKKVERYWESKSYLTQNKE